MAFTNRNSVEPNGASDRSDRTWRARLSKTLKRWAGMKAAQDGAPVQETSALEYAPETVGLALAPVDRPDRTEPQPTAADFEIFSNLGNLDRLNAAISEGTVRIAFAGDSIVEGDRDGLYEHSVVATVMRALREQNPAINFVVGNFSLSGRGIGALATETYVGQPYPENLSTGFYRPDGAPVTDQWPGGSVVGKSWMAHLKDFAPDFVMVMHGANDLSGSSVGNTIALKYVVGLISHFPKAPSIGVSTTALPAVSAGYQEEAQIAADGARGVARELNLTLVDINRAFNLLRSGFDVDNLHYTRDDNFAGYPTGWHVEDGSTLSLANADASSMSGTGSALHHAQSLDIMIKATFSCPNWVFTTCALRYRSKGSAAHQYSAHVSSGFLALCWGATTIGYKAIGEIASGSKVVLQVEVRGALHRVYVNDVLQLSVHDYNYLRRGSHGVAIIGGTGTLTELIVDKGNYCANGVPQLSDLDLYGGDGCATHKDTPEGNGINHPTKLANSVCWAGSFSALTEHIRMQKESRQ